MQPLSGAELPLGRTFRGRRPWYVGFEERCSRLRGFSTSSTRRKWPVVISDRVLARVARGILEGSDPPPMDAFPEELTEEQSVEVLDLAEQAEPVHGCGDPRVRSRLPRG